jgi:hypothetical protein
VKDGFENKYVFRGFAWLVDILAYCYVMLSGMLVGKTMSAHPCAKMKENYAPREEGKLGIETKVGEER